MNQIHSLLILQAHYMKKLQLGTFLNFNGYLCEDLCFHIFYHFHCTLAENFLLNSLSIIYRDIHFLDTNLADFPTDIGTLSNIVEQTQHKYYLQCYQSVGSTSEFYFKRIKVFVKFQFFNEKERSILKCINHYEEKQRWYF